MFEFKFSVVLQLLSTEAILVPVQCCFTSTEAIRTVRDGEPRTSTSTFTQVLNSVPREIKKGVVDDHDQSHPRKKKKKIPATSFHSLCKFRRLIFPSRTEHTEAGLIG